MADLTGVVDPAGSSTSPRGFQAGAVFAGMKSYGEGKLDLAILASDLPCTVAATFTKNTLHSASVDVNRAHLFQLPLENVGPFVSLFVEFRLRFLPLFFPRNVRLLHDVSDVAVPPSASVRWSGLQTNLAQH